MSQTLVLSRSFPPRPVWRAAAPPQPDQSLSMLVGRVLVADAAERERSGLKRLGGDGDADQASGPPRQRSTPVSHSLCSLHNGRQRTAGH
jgi:hypothetical protein